MMLWFLRSINAEYLTFQLIHLFSCFVAAPKITLETIANTKTRATQEDVNARTEDPVEF